MSTPGRWNVYTGESAGYSTGAKPYFTDMDKIRLTAGPPFLPRVKPKVLKQACMLIYIPITSFLQENKYPIFLGAPNSQSR
jgi:hypothetical protein